MTEPVSPAREDVAAWRLVTTLAVAGAIAGLAIVLVYQWAEPRIAAHRAEVLREAIREVLHEPARFDTLYVREGGLAGEPPAGAKAEEAERVYVGYDEAGNRVGFAIPAAEPGFQDLIHLLFGYRPAGDEVIGMRVLEHKETPGLGDKIVKDSAFVADFEGVETPLVAVKPGAGEGDPREVDLITGATISSRTVVEAINERLEEIGPLLEAYAEEGGP